MLCLQQDTDYYNMSFCHILTEMQIQRKEDWSGTDWFQVW